MKIPKLILILFCVFSARGIHAQISGCTDRMASNYNPAATINDGSCVYATTSIGPVSGFVLPENLPETSGLIHWNSRVWTHNDSDDTNIYSLDTLNGSILQSVALTGITNNDWEDISEDRDYIYIGDFGNNADGNRTDLKILKISKSSFLAGMPVVETINFSYPGQVNHDPAGPNNTDYDCEAMVVSQDSIYLFTKQWVSGGTELYSLPKVPGTHTAKLKSAYDVRGLITGAVYLESKGLIALCGYNKILDPFIFLLYDFDDFDFFGGNKRKIAVALPYHQVEAITTADGLKYYITNENFTQPDFISVPQEMHILDLQQYLGTYVSSPSSDPQTGTGTDFSVFPVPTGDYITIRSRNTFLPSGFRLTSQSGQVIMDGLLTEERQTVNLSGLPHGLYIVTVRGRERGSVKIVKK